MDILTILIDGVKHSYIKSLNRLDSYVKNLYEVIPQSEKIYLWEGYFNIRLELKPSRFAHIAAMSSEFSDETYRKIVDLNQVFIETHKEYTEVIHMATQLGLDNLKEAGTIKAAAIVSYTIPMTVQDEILLVLDKVKLRNFDPNLLKKLDEYLTEGEIKTCDMIKNYILKHEGLSLLDTF